jgi:uncharacterized protein (TIGR00369 family)
MAKAVDLNELGQLLVDGSPMAAALGMVCEALSKEEARASLAWRADLVGDTETGVVHGGVVSTLLDHACGLIAFAVLDGEGAPATLDLRIEYYRPARQGAHLMAIARPARVTGMIVFVDALVHDGDESEPLARAHASMMLPNGARSQAAEARQAHGISPP